MADHHRLMISTSELHMSKKGNEERVAVVYHLSRNGNLQHPHFIEVPLSAPEGLYLRGMAGLYSWSCKRSYKSGFVWHDLAENDFIYPVHGQEYVLKGSELFVDSASSALISKFNKTVNSRSEHQSPECKVSGAISRSLDGEGNSRGAQSIFTSTKFTSRSPLVSPSVEPPPTHRRVHPHHNC